MLLIHTHLFNIQLNMRRTEMVKKNFSESMYYWQRAQYVNWIPFTW